MKTALLYIIILLVSFLAYGQEKNNINYLKKNKHSYLMQNGLNGPIKKMSKSTYQGVVIDGKYTEEHTPFRRVSYYFDKEGKCLKAELIMIENGIFNTVVTDSYTYRNDSIIIISRQMHSANYISYLVWLNDSTLLETRCLLPDILRGARFTPLRKKISYYSNGQRLLENEFDLPDNRHISTKRYYLGGNITIVATKFDPWMPAVITISKDKYKNPTKCIEIHEIPDSYVFKEIEYEYY